MDDDREHFDIPPSNIPIAIIGFDLFHISNYGKITEMWQQFTKGKMVIVRSMVKT
jgi:hypothetical protein